VLVLCYHALSLDWTAPLSITPKRLADQLGHLRAKGYKGVTFRDAVDPEPEGRRVAITFDDGYRSVLTLAKPILDSFDMPATVFVPTQYIGSEEPMAWPGIDHWARGEHAHELVPMSWPEARSLADSGWEIGSHTHSHPHLTKLAEGALSSELVDSRRETEDNMQRECASLAYPYGDWDERVAAAAGAAGYAAAGTLPASIHPASPLSYPRIGVYYADDARSFSLKVSPAMRRVRSSRAWRPLVAAARRVMRRPPP
jgi:peptidoglycan/xylan/chitin deacetylase (PgdA/CDA1 family)